MIEFESYMVPISLPQKKRMSRESGGAEFHEAPAPTR
jgi:hypothetical protein